MGSRLLSNTQRIVHIVPGRAALTMEFVKRAVQQLKILCPSFCQQHERTPIASVFQGDWLVISKSDNLDLFNPNVNGKVHIWQRRLLSSLRYVNSNCCTIIPVSFPACPETLTKSP